jgi:hypothetical protein
VNADSNGDPDHYRDQDRHVAVAYHFGGSGGNSVKFQLPANNL